MARIEHVDVENFKSYRGQQRIGPLQPLAAVIGPNGAGTCRPPRPRPAGSSLGWVMPQLGAR